MILRGMLSEIRNEKNRKILIYGAGKYGRQVYLYLWFSGLADKIDSFVVTKHDDIGETIWGVPVISFDQCAYISNDSLIILAMGKKATEEVSRCLSESIKKRAVSIDAEDYEYISEYIADRCSSGPLIRNKVFFSCYMGLGYTCNCKYIAEVMRKLDSSKDIVWEIDENIDPCLPKWIRTVIRGDPEYYQEWYSSRVIVCNNGLDLGMRRRPEQYVIDTWHGAGPTKKIGLDSKIYKGSQEEREGFVKNSYGNVDLRIAASDLCIKNYREGFLYDGEIMKCGYPRNDIFFKKDKADIVNHIRELMGINKNDLMVLYAPTYRFEQLRGGSIDHMLQNYGFSWNEIKTALITRFSKQPQLFYRFHHVTDYNLNLHEFYSEGMDVTDYSDMQELLLASDILITDYSSSMWDFSLTRKPVFLFYNDADVIEKEGGFYRHPDTYPYPKGHTIDELCEAIENFDNEAYQKSLDKWFTEYGTYDDGHASERVAERILDVIEHPEKYKKA